MSVSRCIECGEQVGGGGHTLVAGNRTSARMENIVRNLGGQPSPFNWGGAA